MRGKEYIKNRFEEEAIYCRIPGKGKVRSRSLVKNVKRAMAKRARKRGKIEVIKQITDENIEKS